MNAANIVEQQEGGNLSDAVNAEYERNLHCAFLVLNYGLPIACAMQYVVQAMLYAKELGLVQDAIGRIGRLESDYKVRLLNKGKH